MSTAQDQVQISIELSQAQVDRIVREASGMGSLSVLLSGLADTREGLATVPRELDDTGLSRSLLTGLLMLAHSRPMAAMYATRRSRRFST